MTRGRSLGMALAVLALAPLQLMAQGTPRGAAPMMGARLLLEQGSVEFLAGRAQDLTLDEAQTVKLKEIAAKWATDTKDARETIRAEMPRPGQGTGDREAMRARMQALQPRLQKLVEDDDRALAEAMQVLDEAQQAKAKQLLDERRANSRPRRPGG